MADRDRTDRDQTLRADKADGRVVAPAGAAANKGWSLGGALGWLALALGTLGFIWFVSHQLGAGWEGRENQALSMVKDLKLPGMARSLSESTIELSNQARDKGTFVGQFAWSASQIQGPNYTVKLNWMEGSEHKRAEYNVDLDGKTVVPAGPQAASFLKQAGATTVPSAPVAPAN